ncbi:MAG: hypothetical protein J7L59_01340 [Nanoarchaeota archaeon]|nr:hypothetical protein [Nanoarchaeota archaeon]
MKKTALFLSLFLLGISHGATAHTKILGVMQTESGEVGVVADLWVEVKNGTGNVFIMTLPLTEIDTQASARLAQEVACEVLRMDCSDFDFFYIIKSDYPIVGGPSAGAAMAVTTMAALLNLTVYSNVMITGTINPDGSIGPVGGILAKAEAAYKAGADYVLIPKGQSISYVEETHTTRIGPITQTETRIIPVNVSQYALENWGLKVMEVSEIEDAFKEMTGYEIVRERKPAHIVTSEYIGLMKGMSKMIMDEARKMLANSTEQLGRGGLSYTNYQSVKNLIDQASELMDQAEELYSIGQYYSAASYAVRSLINSNYAYKLTLYYTGGYASRDDVKKDVDDTANYKEVVEQEILESKQVDHIYDVELLAVAVDRLRETDDLLDEAYKEYYTGDYDTALYYDAFAEVRLLTSQQWASVLDRFSGEFNATFDVKQLSQLAQRRLEEARIWIAYAGTVASGSLLESAQSELDKAESAYEDGKYVFSIFESLKALAEANLAMEIRGISQSALSSKVEEKKVDVEGAIEDAKSEGLLPVLAISYYEYAKAYDDPYQSLVFLSYAKEFAKISKDLVNAIVGKEEVQEEPGVLIRERVEAEAKEGISSYVYILAGFLTGLTISLLGFERSKKR